MCRSCALASYPPSCMFQGSPKRAAWVFLLWWADYVGGLVGLVGPESGWLPGLASCRCYWLLLSRAW